MEMFSAALLTLNTDKRLMCSVALVGQVLEIADVAATSLVLSK